MHLKEGDVFDFLHWIKADSNLRGIPFVFFCAQPTELARYVSSAIRSAARVLGAARYIAMETFDEENFRATIKDVLESEVPQITQEQLNAFKQWASEQTDVRLTQHADDN